MLNNKCDTEMLFQMLTVVKRQKETYEELKQKKKELVEIIELSLDTCEQWEQVDFENARELMKGIIIKKSNESHTTQMNNADEIVDPIVLECLGDPTDENSLIARIASVRYMLGLNKGETLHEFQTHCIVNLVYQTIQTEVAEFVKDCTRREIVQVLAKTPRNDSMTSTPYKPFSPFSSPDPTESASPYNRTNS